MALETVVSVNLIEVIKNGTVQVRNKITVIEDGKEISSSFHRHIVAPGDDYSQEDARVKAVCVSTHTQTVVDAYKAALDNALV